MRAGRLRTRVKFLAESALRDGTGQTVGDWEKFAETFGDLRDLRAAEYYSQSGTQNQIVAELWVRFRSDIGAEHRCEIGGVTYEIQGPPVNVDMRNRWLKIRLSHVT